MMMMILLWLVWVRMQHVLRWNTLTFDRFIQLQLKSPLETPADWTGFHHVGNASFPAGKHIFLNTRYNIVE